MAQSSRMSRFGRASSRSLFSQVWSACPPARWVSARLVFDEAQVGAVPDREVPERLRDMAFADPDGPVEDDRLSGVQPPQCGEVPDLRGRQLGASGEVEALEGVVLLEVGAAQSTLHGRGLAAGDLVLAEHLKELQVAEFARVGLGEPGVESLQHAGQLQLAQRRGERVVIDRGDGHEVASLVSFASVSRGVNTCTGWPARCASATSQAWPVT
jgi:hypothetical protein